MAKTKVKMLTSMAGPRHSYGPGEVVEVESKVATAWKKAGIAEAVKSEQVMAKSLKETEAHVKTLEQENASLRRRVNHLEKVAKTLEKEKAELAARAASKEEGETTTPEGEEAEEAK